MFTTLRCSSDTLVATQVDSSHTNLACNTCRSKKVIILVSLLVVIGVFVFNAFLVVSALFSLILSPLVALLSLCYAVLLVFLLLIELREIQEMT